MAIIYPLDAVIRLVAKGTAANNSTQKIVIIDPDTGRVLPKAPLFRSVRYYLVSNSSEPQHVAEGQCGPVAIRDFKHNRSIELSIAYEARCDRGSEEKVAQSLCGGAHPGEVLNNKLYSWSIAFLRGRETDLVENYQGVSEHLCHHLEQQTYLELGLHMQTRLLLQKAGLGDITVGPRAIEVEIVGYNQKLTLEYELLAELDPQNLPKAMHFSFDPRKLQGEVDALIKEYFSSSVRLDAFHDKLDRDVRDGLLNALRPYLFRVGRKLGRLVLKTQEPRPRVEPFLLIEHPYDCSIAGLKKPVRIEGKVQLKLLDMAIYVSSGCRDVKAWVIQRLQEITQETLFRADYSDLCLHFDRYKQTIEDKLKIEAREFGYQADQLIVVHDLVTRDLALGFSREISDQFATMNSQVSVHLEVDLQLRIVDPSKIGQILNGGGEIYSQIDKTVHQCLRDAMHKVEPEEYFLYFRSSRNGSTASLEDRLAELIADRLESEFNARILSISFKQKENALTERLVTLQRETIPLSIEVTSHLGNEPLVFNGSMRILGVDPDRWYAFQTMEADVARIKENVESVLKSFLEVQPGSLLCFRDEREWLALMRLVGDCVQKLMLSNYGLSATVLEWRREPTQAEKDAKLLEEKMVLLERNKYLKALDAEESTFETLVERRRQEESSVTRQIQLLLDRENELVRVGELEEAADVKRLRQSLQRPNAMDPIAAALLVGPRQSEMLRQRVLLPGIGAGSAPSPELLPDSDAASSQMGRGDES